jgi:hypothetical protein
MRFPFALMPISLSGKAVNFLRIGQLLALSPATPAHLSAALVKERIATAVSAFANAPTERIASAAATAESARLDPMISKSAKIIG